MKKALSYTEMDAWFRDKTKDKRHYKAKYIDCIETEPTEGMKIGKACHNYLENQHYKLDKRLKELGFNSTRRVKTKKMLDDVLLELPFGIKKEWVITAVFDKETGDKVLIKMDGFHAQNVLSLEYKTVNDNNKFSEWTPRRVDNDNQLSFYAMGFYLVYHRYFREMYLYQLHTIRCRSKKFITTRGPKDVQYMIEKTKSCIEQMKDMGLWELRKSREERNRINQKRLKI